jgi:FAD/FMN-containing dehydrogenase
MKSTMIFDTINPKTFEIYINSINKLLELNYNLSFQYNFTQLGGQVIKGNSCYFPKKASTVLTIFMSWTYESLNTFSLIFIEKVYKKIIKYTSKYLFPNMIDYDIKHYMEAYYGKNKNELIKIKKIYDQNNVFNWRQSITLL